MIYSNHELAIVNHVAAVVKDLESSIRILVEGFGFKVGPISEIKELGIRVSFVEGENTLIEVIQPFAPGPYMEFLQKGQLGFNHMSIEVDDLPSNIRKLEKLGIKTAGTPFAGAKGEVQNLDPSTTSDLRLQLIQLRH
jgi:hypothetical protein